jgi:xylulokinase
MYLGLDIGTSGVKGILIDQQSRIVDMHTVPLTVSRPHPLWSEQEPEDWWQASLKVIDALAARSPKDIAAVRGIGLAGQMHGAVCLDRDGQVIRPAILWNDGRCEAECRFLEDAVPSLRSITGNIAMPGFTAPKLLWVKRHEPENFAKIAKVLLPKDYIRFRFTGEFFSDMSDAAGTLWLNTATRSWSTEMLAACGLDIKHMPALCEGSDPAGHLKQDLGQRWGMSGNVVFAGGAGDNAAGAIGVGVVRDNQAFISLGTSGVYFIGTNQYQACPERTVHSFCHAVPKTWHQMGVILSAASCMKTATLWLNATDETELASCVTEDGLNLQNNVIFLPYLSGERTPHNDPKATGAFIGLTHATSRADLVQSVLEGVAFAFADCQDALAAAGSVASEIMLIGGGARNKTWGKILASALDRKIIYVADGDQGPAFGAAKLALMATGDVSADKVIQRPDIVGHAEPIPELKDYLSEKRQAYTRLYPAIKSA